MAESPFVDLLLIQQRLAAWLGRRKTPLAAALDPIHGLIGAGQRRAEIILWPDRRNPHAQSHRGVAVGQLERGGDGIDALAGQVAGAGSSQVQGSSSTNSSPPSRPIFTLLAAVAQPAGEGDQQLVAGAVAQVVVDLLEVVEIDEADRLVLLRELALQCGAVEQTGEDPGGPAGPAAARTLSRG